MFTQDHTFGYTDAELEKLNKELADYLLDVPEYERDAATKAFYNSVANR